jgi:ABC-type protease/lipase transport system fused ATPase/permease subunit
MIRADSNATTGADLHAGQAELRAALQGQRGLFGMVLLFSVFVNLLMLTGPLYMLQVYDRVLASGSEPTLVALSILVTALFLALLLSILTRAQVPVIVVAAVATVAGTLAVSATAGILGGMIAGAVAGVVPT